MAARMTARHWLLLVLLSLLWGGSFFFAEVALERLGPLTVVLGRVGLAAPALLLLAVATGQQIPRAPRVWRAFLAMSLLNNLLPFTLIVWGQTRIDSGLAAILNATTPIFAVALAHLLTRDERLTRTRGAGLLLGLAGVAALVGPEALRGFGRHGLGELAVLAAAVSYASAAIYGRRFAAMGLSPTVAAAGQVTTTALLMLPLALVVEQPWSASPTALTWAALLGVALLSTALAYLVYFRLLAAAGATNVMLVTFLIPVSALALGILVLGERPAPTAFLGLALISAGLAAIDGRVLPARWTRAAARDPAA